MTYLIYTVLEQLKGRYGDWSFGIICSISNIALLATRPCESFFGSADTQLPTRLVRHQHAHTQARRAARQSTGEGRVTGRNTMIRQSSSTPCLTTVIVLWEDAASHERQFWFLVLEQQSFNKFAARLSFLMGEALRNSRRIHVC